MSDLIRVEQELFSRLEQLERMYHSKFAPQLQIMRTVYETLSTDEGFLGEAPEGFLELFEVLLKYHEDINESLPPLYKAFKGYHEGLEGVKQSRSYTTMMQAQEE